MACENENMGQFFKICIFYNTGMFAGFTQFSTAPIKERVGDEYEIQC